MRSKFDSETGKYEGNSYNVGDFINVMDYSLKVDHLDTFNKVKELIAFRKANESFRLDSREKIKERMGEVIVEGGNIRYSVDDLLVIHSVSGTNVQLDGEYDVVYSNVRGSYGRVSGNLSVKASESLVLKKAN